MTSSFGLTKTYEVKKGSPPSISWDSYAGSVRDEWSDLLDTNPSEAIMQSFLEKHACMLPTKDRPFEQGNNNPLACAIVTQPELPGLKCKIPDFLYFTGSSAEIDAVLIEIESPGKEWFTSKGQPTAQLTQASNQLTQWKEWFSEPANSSIFQKEYRVNAYGPALEHRQFGQKYILTIGRRAEIKGPAVNSQRKFLPRENETWMTYDRLSPSHDFADAVTVKLDCTGPDVVFRVIHVAPTIKLGPHQYPNYHGLIGLDEAIRANTYISNDRKEFLIERLPYWKTWYENYGGANMISGEDYAGE